MNISAENLNKIRHEIIAITYHLKEIVKRMTNLLKFLTEHTDSDEKQNGEKED